MCNRFDLLFLLVAHAQTVGAPQAKRNENPTANNNKF
jgi:hypothetical protein